jgi:hypothetical protein
MTMATYRVAILSSWAPADAFEYMARFSNAASWDPGVLGAAELDPGPPRHGSRYRLLVRALGRRLPLEYRITDFDPPRHVVLQAQNSMIRSTDVIEVAPATGDGSMVTYSATLDPRGPALLLAPLMGLALRRIGDRAAAGLRSALGGRPA